MNDITALMAAMKAAAEKVNEHNNGKWSYDAALEGVYSSQCYFVTDASKTIGNYIAASCPANVLATNSKGEPFSPVNKTGYLFF